MVSEDSTYLSFPQNLCIKRRSGSSASALCKNWLSLKNEGEMEETAAAKVGPFCSCAESILI